MLKKLYKAGCRNWQKHLILLFIAGASCAAQTVSVLQIQDALGRHDLEAARTLVTQALKANPHDGALLNLRGVVHAESGELPQARSDFSKAVVASPGLLAAWQNWARACQADSGQADTSQDKEAAACAAHAWQHVVQANPRDPEANRGIALAFERSARYAESLRILSTLQPDPHTATADLMIRCLDLSGLKRNPEAASVARQLAAQTDFQQADLNVMSPLLDGASVIPLAEALDSRSELKPDGLQLLAIAYENSQRLPDARKTLERLAALQPENASHLLELAHVAEKQKDYEGALGYLGHARSLSPQNPQVHFLFGVVAAEMDLPVEARRSFATALEIAPANPDYNYAMGSVILSTRDAASAAGYFQKHIAAKPKSAQGHYALGIAEFASGDYAKAKAEMSAVAHDAAMSGGAEYFLGRIERLEGDLNASRQHLLKAIQLLPKFPEAHTELARVCLLEDKLDQARIELTQALQLDPQSFQANAQLLLLYKRTHDDRAPSQEAFLKKLDEDRSRKAELMLRTVEIKP